MDKSFELSITDRAVLGMLLPQQGNFVTLMISRDLQKQLALTEGEMQEVRMVIGPGVFVDKDGKKIQVPEGALQWDITLEKKKKFEFGPKGFDLIYKILNDADKKEKLSPQAFDLFEMIVLPIREAEEVEAEKAKK